MNTRSCSSTAFAIGELAAPAAFYVRSLAKYDKLSCSNFMHLAASAHPL
jgi:hypothetical protein